MARNRKAHHRFEILSSFEAGLALRGTEVKSVRAGKASISEAFVRIRERQAFLYNCHIAEWPHAAPWNHEPLRVRKLLLHAHELRKLEGTLREKGLTLVPLKLYFRGPWAKLEVALARGRRRHDKREATARREAERAMRAATARRRRVLPPGGA